MRKKNVKLCKRSHRKVLEKAGSKKEEDRWRVIYEKGLETARVLKITSEDDIEHIVHDKLPHSCSNIAR